MELIKINGSSRDITDLLRNAEYDLYDRLRSYQNAAGITVVQDYDLFANEVKLGNPQGARIVKGYNDPLSPTRLTQIQSSNSNAEFAYDPFGRLGAWSSPSSAATLAYDLAGNLTQIISGGQTTSLSYIAQSNKFSHANRAGQQIAYAYYSDGWITSFNKGAGHTTSFVRSKYFGKMYDRITSINQTDPERFDYIFLRDGKGRKVLQKLYGLGDSLEQTFYCYAYQGRLMYDLHGADLESGTIYVYANGKLISEYNPGTGAATDLMYDKVGTLRYVCYKNGSTVIQKAVDYETPWGKPSGYGSLFPKVRFVYGGMEYLERAGLYDCEGNPYFPEYGFTACPSLAASSLTSYRPFGNDPIR